MYDIVKFAHKEYATNEDFDNIGLFGRAAVDEISKDVGGWPNHWSQITVAKTSVSGFTITAGYLHKNGIVYAMDADATIDLGDKLPVVATDDRWVAIIARGDEVEVQSQRDLETSEQPLDSPNPVPATLPVIHRRFVTFVAQLGAAGPAPQDKPVINAGDTCIAFVRLTTQGIQEIEPGEGWRLISAYEINNRVTVLEGRLDLTIQRTNALETQFANMSGQLRNVPRPEQMRQMQRDIASHSRQLGRPDDARSYDFDEGLVPDFWDKTHPDWLARVREGIRLRYVQIVDRQLSLSTPGDPALTVRGGLALPKFTDVVRVEVTGAGGAKDISDRVHTVETMIERTESGVSVSFGPSFGVCENRAGWTDLANRRAGETFTVDGQTYVADGLAEGVMNNLDGGTGDFGSWNADPDSVGHKGYAVRSVQYDSWSRTYWEKQIDTYGVNGSVYGQTYLCAQTEITTAFDLKFTRVGSTGAVNLFLCEVDSSGQPAFDRVIGHCFMEPEDLSIGWVRFQLEKPVLCEAGSRYAWFTVTAGNHALAFVSDNKFAQGSLFWRTDGAWAQGSNTEDFCFRRYAAKFEGTRTVVEFGALECPLGMTEIQLLYNGFFPAGAQWVWQIRPYGDETWFDILGGDPTPLLGQPVAASLRAVIVHTTDLAPGIRLDNAARSVSMRVGTDAVAVSNELALGYASENITVIQTMDLFDAAYATAEPTIIANGSVITPDLVEVDIDDVRPERRRLIASFDLTGNAASAIRLRPTFATSSVLKAPFVQDISYHAI